MRSIRFQVQLLIVMCAAVGLLYWPALHGPFFYDDPAQIPRLPALHDIAHPLQVLFSGLRQIRVILNFSFALNWTMGAGATWPFHLTNFLLHALNGWLVFLWLEKVFPHRRALVICASALFLFHPLQSEGVAYITGGRITLLQTMALLTSLHAGWGARWNPWGVCGVLVLSFLCKESGVLLPLFLILQDRLLGPSPRLSLKLSRREMIYLSSWVPMALLSWLLRDPDRGMYQGVVGFDLFPFWEYLWVQGYSYLFHLFLLFAPVAQDPGHDYPGLTTTTLIGGGVGWALVIAALGGAWKGLRRAPKASFFVLLYFLILAPTNTFIQMINPFAEYRLYTPNLSLFVGIGWLFERFWGVTLARSLKIAVSVLLAALVLSGTVYRASLWRHDTILVTDALSDDHEAVYDRILLGLAYQRAERLDLAEEQFKLGIQATQSLKTPQRIPLHLILASLYGREQKDRELVTLLSGVEGEFLARPRREVNYYLMLLGAYRRLGDSNGFEHVLKIASPEYSREELIARLR